MAREGRLALWRAPWFVRACQVALGAVFVAAALPKIGDPASFARQVHNYRLLPVALENLLAILLPWIELVAGVCLVLGRYARGATWVAAALLGVFLVAIGQAVARDLDIECGCFGTADAAEAGWSALGRDVLFLLLAAGAWPKAPAGESGAPSLASAAGEGGAARLTRRGG